MMAAQLTDLYDPDAEAYRRAVLGGSVFGSLALWSAIEKGSLTEATRPQAMLMSALPALAAVGLDAGVLMATDQKKAMPHAVTAVSGATAAALTQSVTAGAVAAGAALGAQWWRPYTLPPVLVPPGESASELQKEFQVDVKQQLDEAMALVPLQKQDDWIKGLAAEAMKDEPRDFQTNPDDYFLLKDTQTTGTATAEIWFTDPSQQKYNPLKSPWPFTDLKSITDYARDKGFIIAFIEYYDKSTDYVDYPSPEERRIQRVNFFLRQHMFMELHGPYSRSFSPNPLGETYVNPAVWNQLVTVEKYPLPPQAKYGIRGNYVRMYPNSEWALQGTKVE